MTAADPIATALPPAPKILSRADVLEECRAADIAWAGQPGRNLVLLFDGTGNILGNQRDTNVVRLMRALTKDPIQENARQLVYYDPGVGTPNTFPSSNWHAQMRRRIELLAGLALGSGAFENIAEAYEFLVHHYREGDRIYLFGFSRGAFTARAVGGMVNMYGLVRPNGLSMMHLMVTNYFTDAPSDTDAAKRKSFASDIQENFTLGRNPLIHFTGVWDTVETIGSGFLGGVRITNSTDFDRKRFVHIRHAVALHETRCKYKPRLYDDPRFDQHECTLRSFEERWFRGVHSDIGGSYPRDGLAVQSLQWMVDAAVEHGLLVDSTQFAALEPDRTLHDETYEMPYWVWTGINARPRDESRRLHSTAMPVSDAAPASNSGRKAKWVTMMGWLLGVLTLLLAAGLAAALSAACGREGQQLLVLCDAAPLKLAQRWGWWWMAVAFLWLPFPLAWSLRRLCRAAIDDGRELTRLQRSVQQVLVVFMLSAVVLNGATYALGLDSFASWIMLAALGAMMISFVLLLFVFLQGATARRR